MKFYPRYKYTSKSKLDFRRQSYNQTEKSGVQYSLFSEVGKQNLDYGSCFLLMLKILGRYESNYYQSPPKIDADTDLDYYSVHDDERNEVIF